MNRRQRKKHHVTRRPPQWRTFTKGQSVMRSCGHIEWVHVRQLVSWIVLKQAAFDVAKTLDYELSRELDRVCAIPAKCNPCSRGRDILYTEIPI